MDESFKEWIRECLLQGDMEMVEVDYFISNKNSRAIRELLLEFVQINRESLASIVIQLLQETKEEYEND